MIDMKNVFKKNIQLALSLLVTMVAPLSAVDCNQSTDCAPICCDRQPCLVSFNAELLYWRPELCGLEGAFGNTTIFTTENGNITTTRIKESHKRPSNKWSPGFRVGADVAVNCVDVELDWTHYDGRSNFRDCLQHGRWKIKYDVIDLTFGRQFCVASCFYLKPFIGLRAAKIHQRLKSHLVTTFTPAIAGNSTVITDKNDKEDFWGIGPQIGLDAGWNLGCNFSLYGKFAVASYYGHVNAKNYDVDTLTRSISICDGSKRGCFNTIATDMAIGIRWDACPTCFCGCDVKFNLNLGLEQHRIYDFSDLGSDGNLSLDGAVFGAGITFNY